MGLVLPRTGRELLPVASVHAVRRSTPVRSWWLLPLAVLAVGYLPVAFGGTGPGRFATVAWILAPFLATVAWTDAAGRAPARTQLAFLAFASAAATAVAAELGWALEVRVFGAGTVPLSAYLLPVPHGLVAVGCILCIGARTRGESMPGITADILLLLLAGIVAAFRFGVEPLLVVGVGRLAVLSTLQGVAVVPAACAAFLVLRRGSALAPRSGILLLGATLALAAGSLLSLSRMDGNPFVRGDRLDLVTLVGWLLFAASGFGARSVASTARAMLSRRRAHDGLRKLIVPGAALFLGLAVLDIGLRPAPRPATMFALGLFACVLALRTAHAFSLVDRDARQRRQIAHTRALVDVSHALAGTLDLDETLRVISSSARSVFGTRAAGIELLTEDGASLEIRAAPGMPETVVGLRFPIAGSFTGWVVQHGEPRATVDPTRDPYVHPQSLAYLGRWPVAAAPLRFRGETLGALFTCMRSEPFDVEELNLLGAMAEQAAIAIQNARLFEQVTKLSITDPLTGLGNRRQLERELAREVAAARRGRSLAAVIFDLDDFKRYNDSHGHLAGDRALRAFADSLREQTRAMNFAARYGGDEFVVLLSDTDEQGARTFIERVRERYAELVHPVAREVVRVSAGLSVFRPEMEDPELLIREADDALYRVKPRTRT